MRIRKFNESAARPDKTFPLQDVKNILNDFNIDYRDRDDFKTGLLIALTPNDWTKESNVPKGGVPIINFISDTPQQSALEQISQKASGKYQGLEKFPWRKQAIKVFFTLKETNSKQISCLEIKDWGFSDSKWIEKYQMIAEASDRLEDLGLKYFMTYNTMRGGDHFEMTIYNP